MAEFDVPGFDPLQCAIRAVIDMNNDFMFELLVLADTINTQFQIIQIVPCGDDDTEHGLS